MKIKILTLTFLFSSMSFADPMPAQAELLHKRQMAEQREIIHIESSYTLYATARSVMMGGAGQTVSILSSGINSSIKELKDRLTYYSGTLGTNIIKNNNEISDDVGIGSHLAGIVIGVARFTTIIPVKIHDKNNAPTMDNLLKGLEYVAKRKSKIALIPAWKSIEGVTEKKITQMLNFIKSNGILVVAGAGDEHTNQVRPELKSLFDQRENFLSVCSLNKSLQLSASSNYGPYVADVCAPGENIVSYSAFYSVAPQKYEQRSGTTVAAAYLAGIAVIALSENNVLSSSALRTQILDTVETIPALSGKSFTGGIPDLFALVDYVHNQ